MKYLLVWVIIFFYFNASNAQNVGIGTAAPNAALDVSSTTNGFLPPRLTIAQRNAIVNPATGLVIFCLDCSELEFFNGTIWKSSTGVAACNSSALSTITICNQFWMQKNLEVSKYKNGDDIPQVSDPAVWTNLTTGAWCWYNNDSLTYGPIYGKLYNWYALNDPRGLAPQGWHLPTDSEWSLLSACLGGDAIAGGKLKEAGTAHWLSPNSGADNSSGFTALPAGDRDANGSFGNLGYNSFWWSTSTSNMANGSFRYLGYNYINWGNSSNFKTYGLSVRCIRD